MDNKPIAIQISKDLKNSWETKLYRQEGFTNNIDYMGHQNGVPVYVNEKLSNKGEIKYIMTNEYKELKPGNYECLVRQVIRKHGKDESGQEDTNKDLIVVELDVKGQDSYSYITFFTKGYSDMSMQISNEQMNELIKKFDVQVLEDLIGKEATLTSKVNEKGYTNLYLAPKREFFDWGKVLWVDCAAPFECVIKKFYKNGNGNKYTFVVSATWREGMPVVTEFVCYDLDKEFKADAFAYVLKRLGLTEADADQEINKPAKLVVKRVTKGDKIFFNKRIAFDKPVKEHYWR